MNYAFLLFWINFHSSHAQTQLPIVLATEIAKASRPRTGRAAIIFVLPPTSTPSRNKSSQINTVMALDVHEQSRFLRSAPMTTPPNMKLMTVNIF